MTAVEWEVKVRSSVPYPPENRIAYSIGFLAATLREIYNDAVERVEALDD